MLALGSFAAVDLLAIVAVMAAVEHHPVDQALALSFHQGLGLDGAADVEKCS